MAHVPKTINKEFRDKIRVSNLRGLNVEKMRETEVRITSTLEDFVIRRKRMKNSSIFNIKTSSYLIFMFYLSFTMFQTLVMF